MGMTVQHLAHQLKLPVEQLIRQLQTTGLPKKYESTTVLSEEELKQLHKEISNNKQTVGNEKDKKSFNYLDMSINKSEIIFIDTSALLQDESSLFLKRLGHYLKHYTKKVILPFKVYEELKKHSDNPKNRELANSANIAIKHLAHLQNQGILEIYGDESMDHFADNVFNTQITRLRIQHTVLLITNDIKLGQDILLLNNSKSVRGKNIQVNKVDRFGFLRRVRSEEENRPKRGQFTSNTRIPEDEKFSLVSEVVTLSNKPLPISRIPEEGNKVFTDKGGNVHLLEKIGSGGEGAVYSTNQSGVVAKIYKRDRVTKDKYQKLVRLVSKNIKKEGICYPIQILYNDRNEFVGYTMPAAKGKELKHFLFIPKKVFENRLPNWTRKDLVQLTITILKKIEFLHNRNIIIGDINPFNILVESPQEVYFVDVDSYQVEGFPCPVGTDNYTAPEIQGRNFTEFLRSSGNEYFAVATLVFSILFLGKSPYSQTGGESNSDNIKAMDFPYSYGQAERPENTPKGQWRFIWSNLPYKVKETLYQTFQKGEQFSTEDSRHNTTKWLSVLQKYYSDLHSGKLIKQDEVANEIFPTRFKMIGDSKKNLQNCRLCGDSHPKWQLNKSICRACLNKGEDYQCSRCRKELIFTNFEKYVRNMNQGYRFCKDCHAFNNRVYKYLDCSECLQSFEFKNRDKEFYDKKGFNYPKRCKECRKREKSGGAAPSASRVKTNEPTYHHSPPEEEKKNKWCFLTTVACEYYDQPDDCYELEILRGYRDQWLLQQKDGKQLIDQYYKESPSIVQKIKSSPLYSEWCEMMMEEYILKSIEYIQEHKYIEAKKIYTQMFYKLKSQL